VPIVTVTCWNLRQCDRRVLADHLPGVVANALHLEDVPEAHLTSDDIKVIFLQGSDDDVHGKSDFGISVEANYFLGREAILQTATNTIASAVVALLGPSCGFFVRPTLPVAGWKEITGKPS
jgi:hypothetical protein